MSRKHKKLRQAAALALGQSQEARAVEPLIRALVDGDKEVEAAAAQSLGQLGALAGAAVGPLEKRLHQDQTHDFPLFPEEERVKQSCREALRKIQTALRNAPAELEAAPAPEGTGTELVSVDAEMESRGDRARGGRDHPAREEEDPHRGWRWTRW